MDLISTWQEIQEEKFNSLIINKEEIMKTIHMNSNTTINQLKTRLGYKRNWIVFFLTVFIIWGAFSIGNIEIMSMIGLSIILYGAGLIGISKNLRQMNDELDFSEQTLAIMKRNYQLISNSLKFENAWSIVSLPLALIVGVVVAQAYRGYTFEDMLQNAFLLKIIIAGLIVIVPIGYFSAVKMNQHGFGGLLEQLKKNIHQMEVVQ